MNTAKDVQAISHDIDSIFTLDLNSQGIQRAGEKDSRLSPRTMSISF